MAFTLKELRELPENKLIEEYENRAVGEPVAHAPQFYDEIVRRNNEKLNKAIKNWTMWIGIMTLAMLVATIVNVLIALDIIG